MGSLDINVNQEDLEQLINKLTNVEESFIYFSNCIAGVDLSGSNLSSAVNFSDVRDDILKISTGDYGSGELGTLYSDLCNVQSCFYTVPPDAFLPEEFNDFDYDAWLEWVKTSGEALYSQEDYKDIPYYWGRDENGNLAIIDLAGGGCGFVSFLTVLTAASGYYFPRDDISAMANVIFENKNLDANNVRLEYFLDNWNTMIDENCSDETREDNNVQRIMNSDFSWSIGSEKDIYTALQEGKFVIFQVNNSTHYVSAVGLSDDGERIIVKDPSSWSRSRYVDKGQEDYVKYGFPWDPGEWGLPVSKLDFSSGTVYIMDFGDL